MSKLEEFNENIKGKRVAIIGLGVSNLPLIKYFNDLDCEVVAFDNRDLEKIEKDTINILKKKFKDILEYIREKDLDNFLTSIKGREIKKGNKLVESYMEDVKKMLFKYEFWFKVKLARNSRKNKKRQK